MRKLGVIAIVFVGLTLLARVPAYLAGFGFAFSEWWEGLISLLPGVVSAVFGVALIWYREDLADQWFDDGELKLDITPVVLLRVALIVIGVSVAVEGLSASLWSSASIALERLVPRPDEFGGPDIWDSSFRLLVNLLSVAIGAFLVARSAPLSEWLWRVVPRPPAALTEEPDLESCPACGEPYDPADYRPDSEKRCVRCGAPLDGGSA